MIVIIFNSAYQIRIFNCSYLRVSARERLREMKQNPDAFTTSLYRSSRELLQTFTKTMSFSDSVLVRLSIHYAWQPICAK